MSYFYIESQTAKRKHIAKVQIEKVAFRLPHRKITVCS